MSGFKIEKPVVKIGEYLAFSFVLSNLDRKKQTIRLEYGMYYRKSNGNMSKKVFKISEKNYGPGTKTSVQRKQSFKKITTRVFYPGKHRLSLIINGEEKIVKSFTLTM